VNVASTAIVIGSVDVAANIANPIPSTSLPPNPILILLSRPEPRI